MNRKEWFIIVVALCGLVGFAMFVGHELNIFHEYRPNYTDNVESNDIPFSSNNKPSIIVLPNSGNDRVEVPVSSSGYVENSSGWYENKSNDLENDLNWSNNSSNLELNEGKVRWQR